VTRLLALSLLVTAAGCDLILGIEDWQDPPGAGGGPAGGAGGGPGGGGAGGAGGGGGEFPNATCADGLRNGDETDVDCGGDACGPCGPRSGCLHDADCSTLSCVAQQCAAVTPAPGCSALDPGNPTCADCESNGAETDVDCGGDSCPPCAMGLGCATDADCASGHCAGSTCGPPGPDPGCSPLDPEAPTCLDCAVNGGESDVDCGGDACPPCGAGAGCVVDADCASGVCLATVCE
jgi:hypothetical protein